MYLKQPAAHSNGLPSCNEAILDPPPEKDTFLKLYYVLG